MSTKAITKALLLLFCSVGVATGFQSIIQQHGHHQDDRFRIRSTSSGGSTSTRCYVASSSKGRNNPGDDAPAPVYGLYDVQEEMLIKRGEREEELMAGNSSPLKASQPKGVGGRGGKGFGSGGGSGGRKSGFKIEAKAHANVLRKEGVVRIDNVLSEELADRMRDYVMKLRQDSVEQVQAGTVKQSERFADVLLRTNRCDLKIPLGDTMSDGTPSPAMAALHHVFCRSAVKDVIETVLTDQAVLYELSCLISDPGSQRQVMHPDNPWIAGREEPTLLTCFIALQDVDLSMGPTVYMPRTNTEKIHEAFKDETVGEGQSESPKDKLLRTKKTVLGTLNKGSCSMYDSRLLHCGSANRGQDSRAIFYFSFRNPAVAYPGNPASIRADLGTAKITLKDLTDTIVATQEKGVANPFASD